MSKIRDQFLALSRQLYPGGRAFKMAEDSFFEGLHIAIAKSEERVYNDSVSVLNSILPDNAYFSLDDASDWERRLGLITNLSVPLASRMLLIKQKMNQPGPNPAKGSALYLQEQLNNAGFNVFVYENKFPNYPTGYTALTPEQLTGLNIFRTYGEHGQFQHGQQMHGGWYNNLIINEIDETKELLFDYVGSLRNSFFIGGYPAGQFANISKAQHDQFRQLILKTKQVQTIGFLLINYV